MRRVFQIITSLLHQNVYTSVDSREGADGIGHVLASMQKKFALNIEDSSDDEAEEDTSTEAEVSKTSDDRIETAEKQRKIGRRAYKKKEFEKAISHFEKAIELNPKEVTFPYRLAETKFEQGKYSECVEYCSRAIKVGKENKGSVRMVARSQVLRGRGWREQGNVDKARADVEKAITFLTTIAMVKLEKRLYHESFDFIFEAFRGDAIYKILEETFLKDVVGKYQEAAFLYKVGIQQRSIGA